MTFASVEYEALPSGVRWLTPRPIDFRAERGLSTNDRPGSANGDGPRHRIDLSNSGRWAQPWCSCPASPRLIECYAPTLRRLARRFRTIQIDYPGENPDDGANLRAITHDDLVDDLFGLLDHLNLSRGVSVWTLVWLDDHPQGDASRPETGFPKAALQGGFARRRL